MQLFALRRLPLGPALITAFLLAALVPALLVGWLLSTNSAQSINTLAENAMSQAAHRVDVGAMAHLGESHTVVNALLPPFEPTGAEAARTRNWLSDPASFETMAFALTQQSPNVPYLYFGTEDGTFFGLEREDRGFVVRFIRPGESGRRHYLIAAPGERNQLVRTEQTVYDPRARPWYQKAIREGKRTFTDVYRSAVKPQFDLTLAQPIRAEDGQRVLGVIAVDMSLARLTELIRSTRISDNAVTYLVDSQGLMVASSVDEPLGVQVDGQFQRISPLASREPLIRASYERLARPTGTGAAQREPGLVHLDVQPNWQQRLGFASNRLIALQRPFGDRFELDWQLIVVAPEDDFTWHVLQARQWALVAMAALIGLCGLLAFLVARGLSGQFRQLNASATAVGAGQVPPVQHKALLREVHHLSQVMHDSAHQLQGYTQEIQLKNEQLRDAAQLLEERVQQRTAELATSREEAVAAVKAKSGFLAVMSHEIRTPLNGVVGMGELLGETALTESQKDLLGVLKASSEQLLSVVDDILDFSKIESGKLTLENLPLDLRGAIGDVHEIVRLKAAEKGLLLSVQVAHGVPEAVYGDITRLRQVLLNLLSNAIKFTATGEVTLRVWIETAAAGSTLGFSVTDTGVGIAPERLADLFQPFAQGDTSTARVYGGTGLGLMICEHLVALMGGHIGVNSTPGVGSTFHFTIPFTSADPRQVTPAPALHLPHELHSQRVLVVDDNLVNLKVASAMLQRLGYRHDTVTDGLQAIDAARMAQGDGHPYHLVLLDSHMPGLDGMATARVLTSQLAPRTPVIIGVSASSLEADRQRCLDAGMSDYLVKPLTLQTLNQTLLRWSPPTHPPGAAGAEPQTVRSAPATVQALPGPAGAGPAPWVDSGRWASFAEFDDAQGSLRRDIIQTFLQTLDERVGAIQRALRAGDFDPLVEAAHDLKGAASNVGALRLADVCDAMDRCAVQRQIDPATAARLVDAAAQTRLALTALCEVPGAD